GSEQDLRLDQVLAGADVRIKTAGSLINAGSGGANVVGGNLILEAANGGIGALPDADGHVDTPLLVNLGSGSTLIARARDDIAIEATDGDIGVDTVYSRGDVDLRSTQGSILDGLADSELNILANNVTLSAQNGSIGTLLNALDVGVNQNGFIDASAQTGIDL